MADSRGTRNPSAKTIKRREAKALERAAALASANAAGYRRGRDAMEREISTRHDGEINVLRNQIADVETKTIAMMDRESVKGWMAALTASNKVNPAADVLLLSVNGANAIARELSRAYSQLPTEGTSR